MLQIIPRQDDELPRFVALEQDSGELTSVKARGSRNQDDLFIKLRSQAVVECETGSVFQDVDDFFEFDDYLRNELLVLGVVRDLLISGET